MEIKKNTKQYVNGIEILTISNVALEEYRAKAKHNADLSKNILELKMSSMVKNAELLGTASGKHIYLFGSFLMIVNHKTSKIEVVSWKISNHYGKLTTEKLKSLREDYASLGLAFDGNSFENNKEQKAVI